MDRKYSTLTELLSAIANSIRRKKNQEGSICADNFPEEIDSIEIGELGELEVYIDIENGAIVARIGNKTTTLHVNIQEATFITPTTEIRQVIKENTYVNGSVFISGDPNLIAENIKEGVSIFGVTGTYKGE